MTTGIRCLRSKAQMHQNPAQRVNLAKSICNNWRLPEKGNLICFKESSFTQNTEDHSFT
ncbi:hypothetical protein ACU8KH_06498 [Lachancea thermotolerans]